MFKRDQTLRQLRRQRLNERGKAVYIRPQAKVSLQALDESAFLLMEKVEEFLASDQMVFLLMGDSGAGKSTFNRELECYLWQAYKKGGIIPLHINLPSIEKPEHDMIAKQLRKAEFTEPQIRELKLHRKFTLICDGYDQSM
jgi:transcriptional regulator with AAA-type ATPase domain